MIRSFLTGPVLSLLTLTAAAQVPGGPLTIAAAIPGATSQTLSPARGGTPYNDLCQNAVIQTLPADGSVTITGDNTGATDTEDFGNPVSWEAFSTDTCSTVTVSYCGTEPVFALVYSILIVGCPEFISNVQNSGTGFCGDGNVTITYESLPAGTYYVPVLMTAGAQGPYTLTISSDVCDEPPANDICANALPVLVVEDCQQGMVMGNNANAVVNSAPPCATTNSQFQDVWYQFDSGTYPEVLITIDPGTIGDVGVEVRDACGGTSIFCAVGDTAWSVAVDPGTNYRVRVFSNNDFGFGGTFGLCITPPIALCDAGQVMVQGGAMQITACANGDDPFTILQSSAVGTALGLVLTDAGDTIISLLEGGVLDPATWMPGEYHVWGLSYDGDLLGAVEGLPLSGLSGTGDCLDLSPEPVVVDIEICQGLGSTVADGEEFVLRTTAEGLGLLWLGEPRLIGVELWDGRGAVVVSSRLSVSHERSIILAPAGLLASGAYTARVTSAGAAPLVKRVFVH